jgi:5-methylcytosine-specific restriction endonuclease McrA
MNWIRQSTRLAIYLRDGLACCYCGRGVESGVRFTLDHVKCHAHGGSNRPENLVTCCLECNAGRGSKSLRKYVAETWEAASAADILRHVSACLRRKLPRAEAREMLRRRGSVAKVLAKAAHR